MPSQVLAIVAASEAVGAEGDEASAEPRGYLVGDNLHEIGGGDNRTFDAICHGLNIRLLFRFGGMQSVPALDRQGIAAELVVAGHAPYIRLDRILFGENR